MSNPLKIVDGSQFTDEDLVAIFAISPDEWQGIPYSDLEARLEEAIDASLSLKFVANGVVEIPPTEETFLDVDLTGDGLADDTTVSAYNPPGVVATDPEWRDFECTADQYAYDKGVAPTYYHDLIDSQFDTYHPDIKRFNQLEAAIKSYTAGPYNNNGIVKIRILNGLHRIWGAATLTGLNSGTSIAGESIFIATAQSATFEASSRGATWSKANIVIDTELPEGVTVGMMYQSGEILSASTNHTASSASAIVTDDLAFLNTGHAIVEIAADRLSFKVDVPHVGTSTTQLVGGNILNTGAGATGFPAGRITISLTQIAFTGGFDGRQDEAWLRPQYGSLIEYADIAFVDTTDPTITRSNGYAPDRKGVFAANVADVLLRQNVGFAGAEGHVLRIAKLVRLSANLSAFGGAGLATRAGRSAYAQMVSMADFTRCSFGNSLTYCLLAAGLVFITAQNCVAVGGAFGVQAITGAHINYQNSLIYGAGTAIFVGTNSTVTVDGGTVIENCGYQWQIRDTSNIVELSAPIVINCGAVVDRRVNDPLFTENIILDKVSGQIEMHHGTAHAFIRNLVGHLHIDVDSAVRDVHMGVTGSPSKFVFDMYNESIWIDGEEVLKGLGAAITNATINSPAAVTAPTPDSADAEILALEQYATDLNAELLKVTANFTALKATQDAILARMRDATPSINT